MLSGDSKLRSAWIRENGNKSAWMREIASFRALWYEIPIFFSVRDRESVWLPPLGWYFQGLVTKNFSRPLKIFFNYFASLSPGNCFLRQCEVSSCRGFLWNMFGIYKFLFSNGLTRSPMGSNPTDLLLGGRMAPLCKTSGTWKLVKKLGRIG